MGNEIQEVQVDLIGRDGGTGEIGGHLQKGKLDAVSMKPFIGDDGQAYITVYTGGDRANANNYITQQVQVNATLRRDEWKRLDEAVIRIAEQRLGGVQDLVEKGLTYNIGDGLGSTVLEYHDVSDALTAELSMDGVTRAKGDRVTFGEKYLPLPIIHADWEINARFLEVSRNKGQPMDTTMVERGARKVNEQLEAMLFQDKTYSYGAGTIYSYVNYPDVNGVTLAKNWDTLHVADGITAKELVNDVIAMKQASINNHFYGPWKIYIPTGYETVLDKDYDVQNANGGTVRQRIMNIDRIEGIKVVDFLPAHNVMMVQMTSDVVRLVQGMGLQNIQWQSEGPFVTKYKVMTIQVPQIRSDQNGKCGIVRLAAGLS